MTKKKLEILAPAGSFESMKAAIHAGADAVYMGGSRFGARAYAENPDTDRLCQAIDYAHLHGVKLYLTVNTLLKEKELEKELYDYLLPYYERGLDAVLVQDFGVLKAIQEWFPDLPIHASTQMTLCGVGGAKILEKAGAERVVLSRELSLKEIAEIHKNIGIEIECFVHGALCYCYSGQCLFSSILGGRSGNRGRCAQPCRLPYEALDGQRLPSKKEESALLSPKDICALDLIPQMAEAGIYSLKIEGRMKRPEYTAGVVRIYRKYVDRYLQYGSTDYQVEEADRRELLLLFNRDGFSRGYYEQHNGRNMMALWNHGNTEQEKRDYEKRIAELKRQYIDTEKKIPIYGSLHAAVGEPMKLVVWTQGTEMQPTLCLEIEGDIPEEAKNHPMEAAQVEKQLKKTGNTPFVWNDLQIELIGNLFLPVQTLNQLRRKAIEQLEEALQKPYRRTAAVHPSNAVQKNIPQKSALHCLHISIETKEQLETVLAQADVLKAHKSIPLTAVYLDAESLETELESLIDRIHQAELKVYIALPNIFRLETENRYLEKSEFWSNLKADGYVIRNLEEQDFLDQIHWEKERFLDHNVYSWNLRSRNFWRKKQISGMTNPLELNRGELKEISDSDSIQIIYGRYPMMVTAGCLHKTLNLCRKESGQWILKDRYQKEFPVKNYCRDCYNIIYNSQPLYLLDQMETVGTLGAGSCRMMFTTEHADEIRVVLNAWMTGAKPQAEFTRGHFKRGVE